MHNILQPNNIIDMYPFCCCLYLPTSPTYQLELFSISLKNGQWHFFSFIFSADNFPSFMFLWRWLILPSFLKDISTGDRILGWQFFVFSWYFSDAMLIVSVFLAPSKVIYLSFCLHLRFLSCPLCVGYLSYCLSAPNTFFHSALWYKGWDWQIGFPFPDEALICLHRLSIREDERQHEWGGYAAPSYLMVSASITPATLLHPDTDGRFHFSFFLVLLDHS